MAKWQRKLLVLSVLLFTFWGQLAIAQPPVFSHDSLAEAKTRSSKDKKYLLIDFTASWCGPCHKMDETTWVDKQVISWISKNANAIQLDVDKDKNNSEQFSISGMPTVIVIEPSRSSELDRHTGYLEPDEFIKWMERLQHGETTRDHLMKQFASVAGRGGEAEVDLRYELAKYLLNAGEYNAAADHFIWLWKNILKEDPAMVGVRSSFMTSEMEQLAYRSKSARKKFAKLRDVEQVGTDDWATLNSVLGEQDHTLLWFDKHKTNQSYLKALEPSIRYNLRGLLKSKGRLKDVGDLYDSPLDELKQQYEISQYIQKQTKEFDPFPREAGKIYEALIAAGRDSEASLVANEALKMQNSTGMRLLFLTKWLSAKNYILCHALSIPQLTTGDLIELVAIALLFIAGLITLLILRRPNPAYYCLMVCSILIYFFGTSYFENAGMQSLGVALGLFAVSNFLCRVRFRLPISLFQKGQYQDCLNSCLKLIAAYPHEHHLYINAAAASINLNNPEKAIQYCEAALKISPRNIQAYHNRAVAYTRLGRAHEAIADSNKIMQLEKPHSSKSLLLRAVGLIMTYKYPEALEDCNLALTKANSPDAYKIRGLAYSGTHQYDLALADFEKSKALSSSKTDKVSNILAVETASILARKHDLEGALAALAECLVLDPKNPWALIQRIHISCMKGDIKHAMADIQIAESINNNDRVFSAYLLSNKARVLYKRNEVDTAFELSCQAINLKPDCPPLMCTHAFLLTKKGKLDEALIELSKAIEMNPYYEESLYFRSEVNRSLGRTAEADADAARANELGYASYL